MPTLAEQMVAGQQGAVAQQGNSVGDALQAYHIAQTAQNARQQLDIQKQENERNKSSWYASQLENINRMEDGPTRDTVIDSFARQAKQVYPDMNVDFPTLLKKDPELASKANMAAQDYASGKIPDPAAWGHFISQSSPDLVKSIEEHASQVSAQKAAALSAGKYQGRVEVSQDNQVMGAQKAVHAAVAPRVAIGQKLDTDLNTLNSGNVSWNVANEVLQGIATVINGGQTSSDFKLKELKSPMYNELFAKLKAFTQSDLDQPADPKYINYLQGMVQRLNAENDKFVASGAARQVHQMTPGLLHNQNIKSAVNAAAGPYLDKSWHSAEAMGINKPQAESPKGEPMSFEEWKAHQ